MVTFSTRRSLPHRQYNTREGNAGDEEINALGLAGLRSWRKTGATRFPFAVEFCPQSEHRNWGDKILFRHGNLSTERIQKLEGQDSFAGMESCPQKEHRNWSDKILFRHGILSTERKQKLKQQKMLFRHGVLSTERTQKLERQDSFAGMESCPQKEHRNWSDKILFWHAILSTERTQKLER